jgi:Ran-binding protein 9/10
MTNSHSQFPSSQIRRTAQMQSMSAAHPYPNPRLYQPLAQPSTTDLPSTIQRPRSAAPSRNASSTSLSTMSKGMISLPKDREREYWLPEYLEPTAYGVWVSHWRHQGFTSQSTTGPTTTNGSTSLASTSMRREASASQTVPSSRNPSPHNHPHLVAQHRAVAFDVAERSISLPTSPNEPPLLPSRFNERDRCLVLEILNDGMDAKFGGPAKGTDSDAASVRADHPIPAACGIYYYEVTILSRGNQGFVFFHLCVTNSRFIGLGFCRASVTLNRLPGWEPDSWGYHGDDGHSFCCQGIGKTYGPTFTTGDIVGCCINFRKNIAFYTKNGVELDTAFQNLTFDTPGKTGKGDFYPSVGLRTPGEHVRVNFGQKPFVFDIGGYVLVCQFY